MFHRSGTTDITTTWLVPTQIRMLLDDEALESADLSSLKHIVYGRSHLQGIEVHIDEGDVVGMLGRRGMGKTTLVRSIAGLSPPDLSSGDITLDGDTVTGQPPYGMVSAAWGLVPQGAPHLHQPDRPEDLTVAARALAPTITGRWTACTRSSPGSGSVGRSSAAACSR
jgi:ABC-type cobalamin/Fe3+-siderophores transport system ATPase subunit